MKNFLIKLTIFALLFVAIDQAIGRSLTWLSYRAKGGSTGKNNEVIHRVNSDIILFGSSRCAHHYVPSVFSDSLGMSCYNAGRDGSGIILMYPYYKLISTRHIPKLVIYDISGYDVGTDDSTKYLSYLRPLYGHPVVEHLVNVISPTEKYKLLCQSYRYNGNCLRIVGNALHPAIEDEQGYEPLKGIVGYKPKVENTYKPIQKSIDHFKEDILKRMIEACRQNGSDIVFTVSPSYGHAHVSPYYRAMSAFCNENGIPFLYYQNDPRFIYKQNYFKDGSHMNQTGAEVYTREIVREILNLINRRRIKH